MKIFIICLLIFDIIGVMAIIKIYVDDCKEIDPEDLAVPLKDRLIAFFLLFILPQFLALLK